MNDQEEHGRSTNASGVNSPGVTSPHVSSPHINSHYMNTRAKRATQRATQRTSQQHTPHQAQKRAKHWHESDDDIYEISNDEERTVKKEKKKRCFSITLCNENTRLHVLFNVRVAFAMMIVTYCLWNLQHTTSIVEIKMFTGAMMFIAGYMCQGV